MKKNNAIINPALALIAWSLVVLVWLYIRRIPALEKLKKEKKLAVQDAAVLTKDKFYEKIPPYDRWTADNYAHLMEQPTIFYALLFYLQLSGHSSPSQITLAWVYVALRVLHTLIQVSVNIILVRFAVFIISSAVLATMVVQAIIAEYSAEN